jgi:hypothetical protein
VLLLYRGQLLRAAIWRERIEFVSIGWRSPEEGLMDSDRLVSRRGEVNPWVVLAALLGFVAVGAPIYWGLAHRRSGPSLLTVVDQGAGRGWNLAAGPGVDPRQIDGRLAAAGANTGGELEVSLAWNTLSDLDLHLRLPSGEVIDGYHAASSTGGELDVDANPTLVTEAGEQRAAVGLPPGAENITPLPEVLVDLDEEVARVRERSRGPDLPGLFPDLRELSTMPGRAGRARSHFTRHPVEHIYFTRAPRGIYTAYAACYSWREPTRNPLPFTMELRSKGRVFHRVTGVTGPTSYAAEGARPLEVSRFQLP